MAELKGPQTYVAAARLSDTGTVRYLHGAVICVTA